MLCVDTSAVDTREVLDQQIERVRYSSYSQIVTSGSPIKPVNDIGKGCLMYTFAPLF